MPRLCREMTKLHEEIQRGPLTELARTAATLETRGEFVLVIGPQAADARTMAADELDDLLRSRLRQDSVKDAVAHAVEALRPAAPRNLCPRAGARQRTAMRKATMAKTEDASPPDKAHKTRFARRGSRRFAPGYQRKRAPRRS